MPPEKVHERRVRVFGFVGVVVVIAVGGDPSSRRVLHAAQRHEDDETLEPLRRAETAVREEPVVADVDRLAIEVNPQHADDQAGPTEEPWHDRRDSREVDQHEGDRVHPLHSRPVHAVGCCESGCAGDSTAIHWRSSTRVGDGWNHGAWGCRSTHACSCGFLMVTPSRDTAGRSESSGIHQTAGGKVTGIIDRSVREWRSGVMWL